MSLLSFDKNKMRGAEIGAKVEVLAASLGQAPTRVSLEAMAEWRPDLVQAVYAGPDGALVDAEGRPVDVGNQVLVPAETPALGRKALKGHASAAWIAPSLLQRPQFLQPRLIRKAPCLCFVNSGDQTPKSAEWKSQSSQEVFFRQSDLVNPTVEGRAAHVGCGGSLHDQGSCS